MTQSGVLSRRIFLKVSASAAGGVLLGLRALPLEAAGDADAAAATQWLNIWVAVDPDGSVTVTVPKVEQGQGIRTALPMILADEMDTSWDRVAIELAPFRWDGRYGWQGVGGSTSVWTLWGPLRHAGAAAREMLKAAAAARMGVPVGECTTSEGAVIHSPTGRRVGYGEVAGDAAAQAPPRELPFKDSSAFTIIGTDRNLRGSLELAVGSAAYGSDVRVEGMAFAAMARAPSLGARARVVRDQAARQVAGVEAVVTVRHSDYPDMLEEGVAVLARDTWSALKGRERLEVEWEEGPGAEESTEGLFARFRELTDRPGSVLRNDGDFDAAMSEAVVTCDAAYEQPLLAHVPMDPGAFFADVRADRAVFRGPMQAPEDVATIARRITGLPRDAIEVQMYRQGGSFGRRLVSDAAAEAIALSKEAGRPVKVMWTRDDDLRHGTYRPTSCHRLTAGMDGQGRVVAWRHRQASTSRYGYQDATQHPAASEFYPDDPPARMVPNFRLEYTPVDSLVPRGPWRSVIHSHCAFAVESFTDELAHAAGVDPLELRLRILGDDRGLPYADHGGPVLDTGRLRRVLERAAEAAGWGRPVADGVGLGLAGRFTFGSYAAQVAEISVDDSGRVTVHRVVVAIDVGVPVNPNGIRAQVEGGVAFGLSAALYNQVRVERGGVVESGFHDHPIVRFRQMPDVEVHIVGGEHPPRGAGETAVPLVAPAVANAIFAVTGVRLRRPPLTLQG